MGYIKASTEKLGGQWIASCFNPLEKIWLKFENLGSSVEIAAAAIAKLPTIPAHYIGGYSQTCHECGVIDRPLIYNDAVSGNVIFRCQSCGTEWIGSTAAEQAVEAEARMREAVEVLHPVLRMFVK